MIPLVLIFLVSAISFLGGWLITSDGSGNYVSAIKRVAGFSIGIAIFVVYGWYWNNIRYDKDGGVVGLILILL